MVGGDVARPTSIAQEDSPNDIPVEIQGVIYIYNPPNQEKLSTGTASAGQASAPAGVAAPAPVGPLSPPPVAPAAAPAALPAAGPRP